MSVAARAAAIIPSMCSIGSDKTSSVALSTPVGVGPGAPASGGTRPGTRRVVAGTGRQTILVPRIGYGPGGSVLTGRII